MSESPRPQVYGESWWRCPRLAGLAQVLPRRPSRMRRRDGAGAQDAVSRPPPRVDCSTSATSADRKGGGGRPPEKAGGGKVPEGFILALHLPWVGSVRQETVTGAASQTGLSVVLRRIVCGHGIGRRRAGRPRRPDACSSPGSATSYRWTASPPAVRDATFGSGVTRGSNSSRTENTCSVHHHSSKLETWSWWCCTTLGHSGRKPRIEREAPALASAAPHAPVRHHLGCSTARPSSWGSTDLRIQLRGL